MIAVRGKVNMNFSIEKILYGTTSSVTKEQRIAGKLNGNLHEAYEPVSIKGKQSIPKVDGNGIVMGSIAYYFENKTSRTNAFYHMLLWKNVMICKYPTS